MSIPDLKGLFEAAQRMQAEVARVRDELGAKTVTAETGGGLVRCVANGKGEVVSIRIDPAVASMGGPEGSAVSQISVERKCEKLGFG